MTSQKKNKITNISLVVIMIVGLSIMLYPTVSNYWNSLHSSRVINKYEDTVESLKDEEKALIRANAEKYNAELAKHPFGYSMSETRKKDYNSQLNVSNNGVMGYIEIESIDVMLPVYHGTDDDVLQVAVGHLNFSSLPVGGKSTHCMLSGHRGLPSAKLFTNLDKLVVGDTFELVILGETLTYEVEKISIVLPNEVQDLKIEKGRDLCSLITCTPYAVNTHRLIVTGHRIENPESIEYKVTADAVKVDRLLVAICLGVPVLLLLAVAALLPKKKRKGMSRSEKN